MIQSLKSAPPELKWDAFQLAHQLIEVGNALSSESNLETLLKLIISKAKELTACDASTIYIREGDCLRFFVSNTETLQDQKLPLDQRSIAGYVVLTGHNVNITDAYQLSADLPYRFNPNIDRQIGYHTCSMLTVPMRDATGQIVGALQLLNRLSGSRPQRLPTHELRQWCIPFSEFDVSLSEALASQAAVSYQNVKLRQDLKTAHIEAIFILSAAAEYRDVDTSLHLKRMSNYSRIIAKHVGLSVEEQELILYASPMHDVGKIGIPDAILLKPGKFTPEERAVMQKHPQIGAEILGKSEAPLMRKSAIIARSHHEKFDGSGYPYGLKGDQIPLEGRIVALADVFDALASRRPYKQAWDLKDIMELIENSNGTHFDPDVVAAFYQGIDEILDIYHKYQTENT